MEKPSGRLTDEEAEVLLCDGSDPHGADFGVVGQSFGAADEGAGGMRHGCRAGVSRPSGGRPTDLERHLARVTSARGCVAPTGEVTGKLSNPVGLDHRRGAHSYSGISWTICKQSEPRSRVQTDNHTNTSSLNFYRPDALPDAQRRVSEH